MSRCRSLRIEGTKTNGRIMQSEPTTDWAGQRRRGEGRRTNMVMTASTTYGARPRSGVFAKPSSDADVAMPATPS